MTTFCVAVCTRNRPTELRECLRSIASSPLVDEVVISSDGSDIETELVASEAVVDFRSLKFLRGPRRGLSANRNSCIQAVDSDYVLFLDDDARLSPEFVELALAAAAPDRLVTGWEIRDGYMVTAHDPDFLGFQHETPVGSPRGIVINATIFPASFLRRRGFDEFYRYGSEEVDIAFAAACHGLIITTVDAGNVHLHSGSTRSEYEAAATTSRIYFGVRRYREFEKSAPRLAAFVALSLVNVVGSSVKQRELKALPGLVFGWARAVRAGFSSARLPTESLLSTMMESSGQPGGTAGTSPQPMTMTVVIPTYRRPRELEACLRGVTGQSRSPDEVLVVRRESDHEALKVIDQFGESVASVVVGAGGQVAALRAGAGAASGDVVVMLDDDAVPRHDWLARIESAFEDGEVSAVGGRDVVHHGEEIEDGARRTVGRLTWYGKAVGNHHIGSGTARSVDFLKGCNSAYRRDDLALPVGLLGSGAEIANDMATCLEIRRRGLRLVYDPRIVVDHFPAERFDEDGRSQATVRARTEGVFNQAYVIGSLAPSLRLRYLVFHVLIGDLGTPGILRSLVAHIRGEDVARGRLSESLAALWSAYRRSKQAPLKMTHPAEPVATSSDERL